MTDLGIYGDSPKEQAEGANFEARYVGTCADPECEGLIARHDYMCENCERMHWACHICGKLDLRSDMKETPFGLRCHECKEIYG